MMEERILRVEEFVVEARDRLTTIETRLDQTATKADLAALEARMHQGFADMIKWVVGSALVLGVAAITVMTFVLNNAVPPKQVSATPPIVIQVPPYPAPSLR